MIPFCSIRRLEDEVSLFLQPPLLVITLPQAGKQKMWGPQGRRARVTLRYGFSFNGYFDKTEIKSAK